jgi:hypothetical protein
MASTQQPLMILAPEADYGESCSALSMNNQESRLQRHTPEKTYSGRHKLIKTHPFCKLLVVEHLVGKLDHGNGSAH